VGLLGKEKLKLFSEYANTLVISKTFSQKLIELQMQKSVTLIEMDAGIIFRK
jgi:hypothetical protein